MPTAILSRQVAGTRGSKPHRQPAGQARRDPHLPGRRLCRGALLHRSDRRCPRLETNPDFCRCVSAEGLRGRWVFRVNSAAAIACRALGNWAQENVGLRPRASLMRESSTGLSACRHLLEPEAGVRAAMCAIGAEARAAAHVFANAPAQQKNRALTSGARNLRESSADIFAANARDLDVGEAKGLIAALLDRLALNDGRIEAIARGLEDVARLPDPVGACSRRSTGPTDSSSSAWGRR